MVGNLKSGILFLTTSLGTVFRTFPKQSFVVDFFCQNKCGVILPDISRPDTDLVLNIGANMLFVRYRALLF
jgi:hypothetical protein